MMRTGKSHSSVYGIGKFRKSRTATMFLLVLLSFTTVSSQALALWGTPAVVGGVAAVGVAAAVWKASSSGEEDLYSPAAGSLQGQTIVITGGTTGLGLETAKRLALGGPSQIVVTARTEAKGAAAVQSVQEYLREKQVVVESKISYEVLDLDSLHSIREAVAQWSVDRIDVLINNAGIMALSERELTVDAVERQMQSNHLGHFLLTALLAPRLAKNARIIHVSSEAHKFAGSVGMDFEYCWKGEPEYGPWKSYGQSKLANILFAQELQRRVDAVAGLDWEVASLHPGAVATDLGRNLFGVDQWEEMKRGNVSFWQKALLQALNNFVLTVPQGATTHVWLASQRQEHPGGQYYTKCAATDVAEKPTSPEAAARLWKESEELVGLTFDVQQFASSTLDAVA